jgi:hypothetical protein
MQTDPEDSLPVLATANALLPNATEYFRKRRYLRMIYQLSPFSLDGLRR